MTVHSLERTIWVNESAWSSFSMGNARSEQLSLYHT